MQTHKKIYNSIQDLKILVFWQIVNTGDHLYLYKKHKDNIKYTAAEEQAAYNIWVTISDEYFVLKKDEKAKIYLEKRNEELKLKTRIELYREAVESLILAHEQSFYIDKISASKLIEKAYETIKKVEPKTKIDPIKSVDTNIDTCTDVITAMISKYNRKFKEVKEILQEEVADSYQLIANVEDILDRNIGNVNKMCVAQYVAYERNAKRKIANIKAAKLKNGK